MKKQTGSRTIRLTVMIAVIIAVAQLYGCNSGSSWEEAEQTDTYEAYQKYIEMNPEGDHLSEARVRADSLYWVSVAGDTAAGTVETYLENFPDGRFRNEAQAQMDRQTAASGDGVSNTARVTGSGVIIRSDHTTTSASAGVVAQEGTVVDILDRHIAENSVEAILKNGVEVEAGGESIHLPAGKAIRVLSDQYETVRASFITTQFGRIEATIDKDDIEALEGETWYQIRTTDNITGWIIGRFIEEI